MVRFVSLFLLPAISFPLLAAEPTWPQFRGPGALGVADDQTLPVNFGLTQNVKWKVPVPPGFSSPIVVGNKLVLTAFDGGKLFTIAYSRLDGKELWRAEAPSKKIEAYHKTESSPAASTPVTDGERIVVYFGSSGLFCYDLAGKELWRYETAMAITPFDFGSGVSPVIADGKVILVRDQKFEPNMLAIDVKTGSKIWEVRRDGFGSGWCTPAIWDTPDGKQIAIPGTGRMVGYDLKTGSEKWTVRGMPSAACASPIVVDGNLIYCGWSPGDDFKLPTFAELLKDADKNGNGALDRDEAATTFIKDFFDNNDPNKDGKITAEEWAENLKYMSKGTNSAFVLRPGGTGDITKSHVVWKETKGLPYVPSPLVYRGQIYTINMRGLISARELKTGKEVFLDENIGLTGVYSSPVAANGHIYIFGLDGTALVLKPGDIPDVVHRAKLGERIAATPAIADNALYVRTAKQLIAFTEMK